MVKITATALLVFMMLLAVLIGILSSEASCDGPNARECWYPDTPTAPYPGPQPTQGYPGPFDSLGLEPEVYIPYYELDGEGIPPEPPPPPSPTPKQ